MRKTVIIGASHSGQMVAREIKRFEPNHEVVLIEKEIIVPFIASGINMVLQGAANNVRAATAPIVDLDEIGVKKFLGYEVTKIDWQKKDVFFTNGEKNLQESYDNLVLATGTRQYMSQKYEHLNGVYCYKSFSESENTLTALENAQTIAISGLGYVGVELAEALTNQNKKVFLIDPNDQLVQEYYDGEISEFIKNCFEKNNTSVFCQDHIIQINEKKQGLVLQLTKNSIDCDVLIIAHNSRPNSELYWEELRLLQDKSVAVNQYLQTSQPNVYAVGDLIKIPELLTSKMVRLSQVAQARQSARIAALNIVGKNVPLPKHLNVTTTQLFGFYLGSVGLTKEKAQQANITIDTIQVGDPISSEGIQIFLHINLQEKIVGAQVLSKQPIQLLLDLLGIVIRSGWQIGELYSNTPSFFPTCETFTPWLNEAAANYLAQVLKKD